MNKPYKVGAIVLFLVGLLVFVRLYGGWGNDGGGILRDVF